MKTNKFKLIVAILVLAFVIPQGAQAAEKKAFSDVEKGAWYEATVEWAVSNGVVNGYTDGTFRPSQKVTEAEFLTMILRAFEPNLSPAKGEIWSNVYYNRAKELNYPVISYTDIASRNKTILRKQVAELISSTEGVNFSGDNAIHYMLVFGLAEGSNPNDVSIKSFEGDKVLTRAEAVQFVKNFTENGIGGLLERPIEPSNPDDLPPIRL